MRERRDDVLTWPLSLQLTHTGNAAKFAAKFGDRVRFTVGRGWLVWDGKRWAEDNNEAQVTCYMQAIGRGWYDQAGRESDTDTRKAITHWASRTLNRNDLANSLICASKTPEILAHDEDFDADPYLLNVQNGVLDLRTGALHSHDPNRMCSRIAGVEYDPQAQAPRWQQFRREIFGGDETMVEFDRLWDGYCLTGDTREQRYQVAWGNGANGKSTKFEAVRSVLGGYMVNIRTSALAARRNESDLNTDLARLPGARLALCPEWDEDMRADESMLKSLTGGDVITARTLYKLPYSFRPQAKFVIYGNHKPGLRGTDTGTWRRPLLVPYTETFSGARRDDRLTEKLQAEAVGILADVVQGCLAWQRSGLIVPQLIADATAEYRKDSNDVAQFLAECCVRNPNAHATVGHLHAEYVRWGGSIRTAKKFGGALRELGYQIGEKGREGRDVQGLGLENV
jgi:putative DNA primase/helicase